MHTTDQLQYANHIKVVSEYNGRNGNTELFFVYY